MSRRSCDVLILGGGVIGLTCAQQLLKAGRSVTVLEQAQTGSGASHGNCGTITPSHATPLAMPGVLPMVLKWMLQPDAPFYIKPRLDFSLLSWLLRFSARCNWANFRQISAIKAELLLHSRAMIETLVREEQLACEFESNGTLYVYRDPRAFAQSLWLPKALEECAIPVETMDGAAARAREPALNHSIVGAYFHATDAQLRPDRYVAELARLVRTLGGTIEESTRITGFRIEKGGISAVATDKGEFVAREVVCALGAWSAKFVAKLGLRLPMQPGKGYSISYERPAVCPRIPLVLKERSVCVTAWSSGYRLGSTMEFSGYDASLNRKRLDVLKLGAAEYLHEPVGARVIEEWYGWRPMTYDDLPIIGRVQSLRNLVLATGHGMLGVSLSAITGQLVSEIINGQPPSVDITPLSPARFGC